MGEQARGAVEDRAAELRPRVEALGRFLTAAPLANGTTGRLDPGVAELLAEAVLRWQSGEVWDAGRWTPRGEVMPTPEAGEVRVETLAGGAVVKMTHESTGLTALGEDVSETWNDLRRKVKDHGED
jgi:hypothetical protein